MSTTPSELAAIDFAPMQLDSVMMTPAAFRERLADVYTAIRVSVALLQKDPAELGALLVGIDPDSPTNTLDELRNAREWLEGAAAILGCAEARAMVALARAMN